MNAALRFALHMIGAVLRIILDDKDQRAVGIRAVGNLVDRERRSVGVIGHLHLGRVHPVDCRAETAEVIMRRDKDLCTARQRFSRD